MSTKFYLRSNVISGRTVPAVNSTISATTPTQNAALNFQGALTAKSAGPQSSNTLTTNGTANAQPSVIQKWVSDPLIGQTIVSQAINISIGGLEANAGSNFIVRFVVGVWRPSTSSLVGLLTDLAVATAEPGTSQTSLTAATVSSTQQVAADGDILVFEVWRDSTVPGATTARANTIFYDGLTEASLTTNAAFINLGTSTLKFLSSGFAQAQADIKAKSNGFAQAQAKINSFGVNTFAQAQAQVIRVTPVFAQAQAIVAYRTAADTFTRSVSSDWGSADVGGPYTSNALGTQFSVDGTRGLQIATGASQTRRFYLPQVAITDTSIQFRAATDKLASGASLQVQGTVRQLNIDNDYYTLVADFTTGQAVQLAISKRIAGVQTVITASTTIARETHAANRFFWIKFEATGSNPTILQGKIWQEGTPEPSAWDITGSDAVATLLQDRGGIGLRSFNSTSGNIPNTFYFDDLTTLRPTQNAQAQADVKATSTVFAQAQANIKITTNVFAQAQSDIKATNNQFAQSQADIKARVSQSAQAQARIARLVAFDNFNNRTILPMAERTTWGPSSDGSFEWNADDFFPPPLLSVDGSAHLGDDNLFRMWGYPRVSNGLVQFDYWIPTAPGQFSGSIGFRTGAYQFSQHQISSERNDFTLVFTPDEGSFYTFKGQIEDVDDTVVHFKVWKTGTPEPAWQQTDTVELSSVPNYHGTIDVSNSFNIEDFQIDNFYVWTTEPLIKWERSGYAQARIKQTYNGFAQAQADIKATTNTFAQAQARIARLVAFDDFNRADTTGTWGTASSGFNWVLFDGVASIVSNTGAIVGTNTERSAFGYPRIGKGILQLDVWIGSVPDTGSEYQINIDGRTSLLTVNLTGGPLFDLQVYNYNGDIVRLVDPTNPDANTWYTVKYLFSDVNGQVELIKVWKTGTQEPDWQITGNADNASGNFGTFGASIRFQNSGTETAKIDNIYWWNLEDVTIWPQSGYAQARIKQIYNAFAQAQAQVIRITPVFAQAQANIKQTYNAFAQAQASITGVAAAVTVYAQAQADIKQTYQAYAQAQARIARLLLFDDFNNRTILPMAERTTWGTSSDGSTEWNADDFSPPPLLSVDGSAKVGHDALFKMWGYPRVSNGIFQVDVWVPAANNFLLRVGFRTEGFQISKDQIASSHGDFSVDLSPVVPSSWYTFKGQIESVDGTVIHLKAWKTGTTEPYWQVSDVTHLGSGVNGYRGSIDVNNAGSSSEDFQMDNFYVWTTEPLVIWERSGYAQAQIKQTYNAFAQAQATIRGNAFGQAQGDILQTYQGYAQGQADIKQTYNGFAQAQADINATSNGFGQSQADIKATSNVCAQAQADIKQTYNLFAHAQADIKQTYQVYAQAQADILTTNNVCAQAQADIKATSNGFGQSQADILAVSNGYGQAQGDIKQTYQVYAQSQADILATSQGYANAQADILVTTNQFAQAQARILTTYNQWAQANADILATSQGYAQAQGKINAFDVQAYAQAQSNIAGTTYPSGQAQAKINAFNVTGCGQAQADIKATSNGFGQSNADILATSNGFGQSQADILATYQGYAQANADIKATSNGYANAQADIKAIGYAFGQSQADIKQAYQDYAQANADIKAVNYGFGQAQAHTIHIGQNGYGQSQADIKATSQGYGQSQAVVLSGTSAYGQAQGTIKATVSSCGQAQADIKTTYQSYGQAQSDIKVTTTVCAQANALIVTRVKTYAQAQGSIKATSNASGNAQADVQATYNGSGQAQGDVKAVGYGFGQAAAYIKLIQYAFAQAQATIRGNAFAQAQADILATSSKSGNAQAAIKISVNVSAQAQGQISTNYYGFGQSQATIQNFSLQFGQAQALIVRSEAFAQAQALIDQPHRLGNLTVSDSHSVRVTVSDELLNPVTVTDAAPIRVIVSDSNPIKLTVSDAQTNILTVSDSQY